MVLSWLPSIGIRLHEPLPAAAMVEVRQLRVPLSVAALSFCVAGALQLWCLVQGWYFLLQGLPSQCEGMRNWLIGYCLSLSMVPFANVLAVVSLIWWVTAGHSKISSECQNVAPYLSEFLWAVQTRGIWTLICIVIFAAAVFVLRKLTRSLREVWASDAPTLQIVIQAVIQAPAATVPADAECAICLESVEESVWKALPCEHAFHQDCLLRWLRCGRRCPLCRLDLHRAFLETAAPAVSPDPGEVSG